MSRGSDTVDLSSAQALDPVARLPEEWGALLSARGEPSYRGRQIFRWIHARGVFDPVAMTDLPRSLREDPGALGIATPGRVVHQHRSLDQTRKLLVEFADGARVECVLIPMGGGPSDDVIDADAAAADDGLDDEAQGEGGAPAQAGAVSGDGGRRRITLCVSTQYGCAMGCTFCASGRMGLGRGLTPAEIVYQVLAARDALGPDEVLRNLVFMGMGEPLHHYEATARAIRLLIHPEGTGLGPRRITVSTVGLVGGIRRLGDDFAGKVGLAVSLHAPDDATRDLLVPMNRKFPIADLIACLRAYPLPRRRRITIEYTLIDGVNDAPDHARRLARLLRGLRVKVNLIPLNAVPGSPFGAPSVENVATFRELLVRAGYSAFVRTRRGDDVAGACGQLAIQGAPAVALRTSKVSREGAPSA